MSIFIFIGVFLFGGVLYTPYQTRAYIQNTMMFLPGIHEEDHSWKFFRWFRKYDALFSIIGAVIMFIGVIGMFVSIGSIK